MPQCSILQAKLNVEQDGMNRPIFESGVGLFEVLSGQHFETFRFEPVRKQFAVGRVILDHQNAILHDFSASTGGTARCNCLSKASCHWSCFWNSAPVFAWI